MISDQKINKSNLEKITPENITQDLYQFIMMDWKSTSLIAYRKNKSSKKLNNCIGDIVNHGMKKSNFWYSSIIPEMSERVIDEKKKEMNYKGLENTSEYIALSSLKEKINFIYENEKPFQTEASIVFFKNLVIEDINNKYMYMEQLRPNYWEQFIKDYYPEKGIKVYKENYENKRRKAFKGISFEEIEETQFYNNIALPFIAKRYKENVPRITALTDASLDYTFKINVFKNTYLLTQKLLKLKTGEIPLSDISKEFSELMSYKPEMTGIEKRYFEEKKKKDLTGILHKIKNKN